MRAKSIAESTVSDDLGCSNDPARLILDGGDGQRNVDGLAVASQPHGFKMFNPVTGTEACQDFPLFIESVIGDDKRELRPTACSAV